MENAIWEEEQTEKLTEVADDVEPFVYDDDNFSYNLWLTHHTAVPNVENKSVGWDDFLTSLFQIIIGVKMIEIQKNYKLTLTEGQAQELYGLLKLQKGSGRLTTDHELVLVYDELKNLFDTGMR